MARPPFPFQNYFRLTNTAFWWYMFYFLIYNLFPLQLPISSRQNDFTSLGNDYVELNKTKKENTMEKYFRQIIFLIYAFLLRWPIWLLIWIFGRSGMFKTLFLIYPTDTSECLDFCPNIKWLRNFFSGRPTPAGLIMNGWRPMGIYLVIPNSSMELMRKKNRPLVETIIRRMQWARKISGARTIGLAGQLGPIFEKRHGIPMEPPFYSSTYGNIFSIQKAVSHLVSTAKKTLAGFSIHYRRGTARGRSVAVSRR